MILLLDSVALCLQNILVFRCRTILHHHIQVRQAPRHGLCDNDGISTRCAYAGVSDRMSLSLSLSLFQSLSLSLSLSLPLSLSSEVQQDSRVELTLARHRKRFNLSLARPCKIPEKVVLQHPYLHSEVPADLAQHKHVLNTPAFKRGRHKKRSDRTE